MGRIFVLGAGAMAESFIKGVLHDEAVAPSDIVVMNRQNRARLQELTDLYGIGQARAISDAADADVVILSVKPYDIATALQGMLPYLNGQLLISFAAGIPIDFIEQATERRAQVIRAMPNLPVAVLAGAIAISASKQVSATSVNHAKGLLAQLGVVVELEEQMMDAATAFSGSGPGFVSYFLEAMEQAAVQLGFSAPMARELLIQTVLGTAKILQEWRLSPAELRVRVTSPNGTTHAGLNVLNERGMQDAIAQALIQAANRSQEMGQQYTAKV